MDHIINILYWLSTGLLVPVTVFLIFFFIRSLILIGGFYGIYISRSKINAELHTRIDTMDISDLLNEIPSDKENKSELLSSLVRIKENAHHPLMLDKILGDYEIQADKELGKSKLLVKIGPMPGLMVTLIPM